MAETNDTHHFAEEKTIQVSGISEFVKEQLALHFQESGGSKLADSAVGDVAKVHVCPNGRDCVLVEFSQKAQLHSEVISIHDSSLTVKPYSKQTLLSTYSTVSKIWDCDTDKSIDTPVAADVTSSGNGKPVIAESKEYNRTRKQSSTKEKRQASFEQRRNIGEGEEDATSFGDNSNDAPLFQGTTVKLDNDALEELSRNKTMADEILQSRNITIDTRGILIGKWEDVASVYNPLHAIINGESSSSEPNHDNSNSAINVDSLLLRYIMEYHYEVYEAIENFSSQITFEFISPREKLLNAVMRDGVEDEYHKSMDNFINLYQKLHQDMIEETVFMDAVSRANVISKIRAQFPVIVSCDEHKPNQITLYGLKEDVKLGKSLTPEMAKHVPRSAENSAYTEGSLSDECLSCPLSAHVKLFVHQGDITEQKVDAIVNPANECLEHYGGAAKMISSKGGSIIQLESDRIMRNRWWRLQPGDVETTSAGSLPCNFILHAVGPKWNKRDSDRVRYQLKKAVTNSLHLATVNRAQSIAIPAISSGIFGVPVNICAQVLFDAAEEFVHQVDGAGSLAEIRFVNIDEPTVMEFRQEMKKRYRQAVTGGKIPHDSRWDPKMNGTVSEEPLGGIAVRTTPQSTKGPGGGGMNSVKSDGISKNHPINHNYNQSVMPSNGNDKKGVEKDGKKQDQQFYQAPSGNKAEKSYSAAVTKGSSTPNDDKASNDDKAECPICLEVMINPKILDICKHSFCKRCIEKAFEHSRKCPLCSQVYGELTGNQPNGRMTSSISHTRLPGYQNYGTITVIYSFPGGTQGSNHPNPGKQYQGTSRKAYLPDNTEGRKVLKLLRIAFDRKLTFTVGRSSTTGTDNCVIWNDIHHKTNFFGGPTNFGYPDPDYLRRVQEELAAKGIKE